MDNICKFLQKLSQKELKIVDEVMSKIQAGDLGDLDNKKLKGFANIFRVRKGNIRIRYQGRVGSSPPIILDVQYRSEKTYRL